MSNWKKQASNNPNKINPVLNNEQLSIISSYGEVMFFEKDQYLWTEGDKSCDCFVVIEGFVQIINKQNSGKKIIVVEHGPLNFTGEVSLLTGRPATVSCLALSKVETIKICSNNLSKLMMDNNEISDLILNTFTERRKDLTYDYLIENDWI